jgi:hypothetical protein
MRDACPHCGQEMDAAVIDGDGCIRLTMQLTPPFRTHIATTSGPSTVEVNSEFRRNVITGEIVGARKPAGEMPARCRRHQPVGRVRPAHALLAARFKILCDIAQR